MNINNLKDLVVNACQGLGRIYTSNNQLFLEVEADDWLQIAAQLKSVAGFNQLIDLCGIDYLTYGLVEWETTARSSQGFSRGIVASDIDVEVANRFMVAVQLLSTISNVRLTVKVKAKDIEPPIIPSVCKIWSAANWFEREAFDLFGIVFEGHPDLRRILTDYGFVGHPFRKDFPLTGKVELRYDHARKSCVYEPCELEMRVTVPRVIRPQISVEEDVDG